MRVLYVEDNPANLFLVKRVARMGNHDVVNFIDGEEALRKIDNVKPDLILMDLQLAGGLNGLDVVRQLRADGFDRPIIAVTAYAMVGDKERCIEAGCNDYLPKPIPIARLVEIFEQYQAQTAPAAPAQGVPAAVQTVTVEAPAAADSPSKDTPAVPAAAEVPAVPPVENAAEPAASAPVSEPEKPIVPDETAAANTLLKMPAVNPTAEVPAVSPADTPALTPVVTVTSSAEPVTPPQETDKQAKADDTAQPDNNISAKKSVEITP